MAVLQMQKLSVCALKENRKAILETLQSMGVMEVIHETPEDGLERMDTNGARNTFEKNATLSSEALEILQRYAPVKTSLLAGLSGKTMIETEEYKRIEKNHKSYLKTAQLITNSDKEIAQCKAEIVKLSNQIESLTPWSGLDVPMNSRGTTLTTALIGTMPGVADEAALREMIAEWLPEVDAYDAQIISVGNDLTYLAILCMSTDAAPLEEVLREHGFVRPSFSFEETPSDKIRQLTEEIDKQEDQIHELEGRIRDQAGSREDLKLVSDYYRIRADKYDLLGDIPQSKEAFFIEGYVPTRYAGAVANILEERYGASVGSEFIEPEEDVPVSLRNNRLVSCGEGVLASFGLPGKDEIDPTMIMTIFYVFFFGLMLSDAAYGAIVSIACGVLLLKCPRMGKSMRQSIQLFFWCGLSTLFWGVMFGGYFGDVINVVSRTFFGHEVSIPAVWFVPLNEPMRLLLYSMLFGVIHLYFGLGIKGYMLLRDHDVTAFVFDVVCWYLLLTGLILMLVPTELFASIAQATIVFPDWANMLSKVMAIAGALGILFMSGRRTKNFGLRIALGAYDLYNITGWLSDVLSYSRLLALGLATGVIASVVNQMGSMVGGGVFGVIVFILVFLIGHTFNIGINLLGAYVHTCRLQYVEFFGKFYDGGGKAFEPFENRTKYVDIKEEKNL